MASAIRRSAEWLADHNAKAALANPRHALGSTDPEAALSKLVRQNAATKRFQALGRLPKGVMNKTEAAYAELLDQQRATGAILAWRFHPMNVRLAQNTFYEVDFLVLSADLALEIHEVKGGFVTEKGQIKIKLCAESLPWFRFYKVTKMAKKDGGGWKKDEFHGHL